MPTNKKDLYKYSNLKEKIETKAEDILRDYFDYKNWKIPTDFSITSVDVADKKVYINYYGFMDNDCEIVSIEYFITKDRKYLNDK